MRDLLEYGLAMGRATAEARMLDTCRIRRVTGETSDDHGRTTVTYETVYEGKCRLVDSEGVVSTPEAAGMTLTLRRTRVDVPVGQGTFSTGDVVEVLASVTRPDLAGAEGRVTSAPIGSQVTAHRLGVEETT